MLPRFKVHDDFDMYNDIPYCVDNKEVIRNSYKRCC